MENTYEWKIANNVQQVHLMLLESDKKNALNGVIPQRNIKSTAYFVENDMVEILENKEGKISAMYTLSLKPLFDTEVYKEETPDIKAAYLCRLCVSPENEHDEYFTGIRSIKRAIERAKSYNCNRLRCEINPDLVKVKQMFLLLDFKLYMDPSEQPGEKGLKKAFMQKEI